MCRHKTYWLFFKSSHCLQTVLQRCRLRWVLQWLDTCSSCWHSLDVVLVKPLTFQLIESKHWLTGCLWRGREGTPDCFHDSIDSGAMNHAMLLTSLLILYSFYKSNWLFHILWINCRISFSQIVWQFYAIILCKTFWNWVNWVLLIVS